MDEVVSRENIAQEANAAAMRSVQNGRVESNRYQPGTEAHRVYEAAFARYYRVHSGVEDSDGGA